MCFPAPLLTHLKEVFKPGNRAPRAAHLDGRGPRSLQRRLAAKPLPPASGFPRSAPLDRPREWAGREERSLAPWGARGDVCRARGVAPVPCARRWRCPGTAFLAGPQPRWQTRLRRRAPSPARPRRRRLLTCWNGERFLPCRCSGTIGSGSAGGAVGAQGRRPGIIASWGSRPHLYPRPSWFSLRER